MAHIEIIGAGITGLAAAVALQAKGHRVQIRADRWGTNTCSGAAGAVWYPVRTAPLAATQRWAQESFVEWERLSQIPGSGVRMMPGRKRFFRRLGLPWWRSFVEIRVTPFSDGVGEFHCTLPVIDPPRHLAYLEHRIQESGGSLIRERVPATFRSPHPVLWCTGWESKGLFRDETITLRPGGAMITPFPSSEFLLSDGAPKGTVTQVPRLEGTYWGTLEEGEPVDRLTASQPPAPILWGTRAMRRCLRIGWEENGNLGFNYGHGKSGYTLAWGAAHFLANSLPQ